MLNQRAKGSSFRRALFSAVQMLQVPGCKVVPRNNHVRLCGGDCRCKRNKRQQAVVSICLIDSASPAKGMAGRAHSLHGASGVGQSHRQPSSRKPTTGGGKQDLWFHSCPSLPKAARCSVTAAGESRCKSSVIRVFICSEKIGYGGNGRSNKTVRGGPILRACGSMRWLPPAF
jgi:hypothetical protein